MKYWLVVIITTLILAACGGGGGGSTSASDPTSSNSEDTIAPVITPPDSITLTATDPSGIAKTNLDIVNFLGQASVQDNIDETLEIINDAPTQFPIGITTVSFTSSDISGNQATVVTADVTVQPPADGNNALSGKVIDGYISGATAYLDLNYNNERDSGEPWALSGTNGDFTFQLSEAALDCASYVPTVVEVPVGAEDSELGVVTEAYKMVLPPLFAPITDEDILNVTPLTSVVWNAIESELNESASQYSCLAIKENTSKRERIIATLETAIGDVVRHYNIPESKIFGDFIAENDDQTKAVAINIVKGLKKGLSATLVLQEEYPNATWAKINYYMFSSLDDDESYPDAWYRDLEISNGNTIIKELVKVSSDLSTEIRPILYEKTTTSTVGSVNLREEIGYESRGGDSSPYNCSYKESASFMFAGAEYELVNLGSAGNVDNVDDCELPDFSTDSSSRYALYRSIFEGVDEGAQFTFFAAQGRFPALNNWTNLISNTSSLSKAELVDYIDNLPVGFCSSGLAGATNVTRSRTLQVGNDSVNLSREESGTYTRTTRYADGTSNTEVSTIADAIGWDDCDQLDTDGDGAIDSIDPDDDNDNVLDSNDAFPFNPAESQDTDSDGIGNNADGDDDNDGLADRNDEYPLDPGNVNDSDGDGIVDRDDIFPDDAIRNDTMRVDFSTVEALGLGSVVNRDSLTSIAKATPIRGMSTSYLQWLSEILLEKAYADDGQLQSLSNVLGWNATGGSITDTLLSSGTKFIAEAAISPDGKYLYLLTSAHIQRALTNMDEEYCSLYRVTLANNAYTCLLDVDEGDIQPRSLNSGLRFDNSRGGMVFRADGAALVHGFNWQRLNSNPEPCECASGSVWFMTPEGELFDLPRDSGWEATSAVWINDEQFAVPESNVTQGGERIAIYNSATLERELFISGNDASRSSTSLIKAGEKLHWEGHALDLITLEIQNSNTGGLPVVDQTGERLFYFAEKEADKQILDSQGNKIIDLVADGAVSYNWQEQSGVGTDIKYTPLAFGPDHIAFMKVFPPDTPIVEIEGTDWSGGGTIVELPSGLGTIELHGMNTIKIFPSAALTSELTINYSVANGIVDENKTLNIPSSVFDNWRADSNAMDHINWALPESEIEGFCVYEYATELTQCTQLSDYSVLAFDMESDRSTRYDDDAVCPDGLCNAFPGISNIILLDDFVRVYFKDSTDHKYYEAEARIDDFMAQGEEALLLSSAQNGAGEVNIITAATKLTPLEPLELAGISVSELTNQQVDIDFGQTLSQYASLPKFQVWNGNSEVPLAADDNWNSDRSSVTLSLTSQGLITGTEHEVRILDPIFLVNSTRRYIPAENITFTPRGVNAFQIAMETAYLRDFDPATNRSYSRDINLSTVEGTLSMDLENTPLNLANMQNATSGGNFKTPTLIVALARLPVGQGDATFTMELTDGDDGIRSSGERAVHLTLNAQWQSDGASGSITIPRQEINAYYVNASGDRVDVTVDNLDSDMISLTSNGAAYPANLDIKLLSALQKVAVFSPSSLLSSGSYTVTITTTLPIVDGDENTISQLSTTFKIGE
ncbi:MAG: hypothetical protein ACN4EJ_07190 [Porticoccaceae bacterium]